MVKVTRNNLSEHLIEKQFSLIGKTVQEAVNSNTKWKEEWTISSEKQEEFIKYAIPLIKRVFKCSRSKAISNALNPFLLNFGLKIKD